MEEQELQILNEKYRVTHYLKLAIDLLRRNYPIPFEILETKWYLGLTDEPRLEITYKVDDDYTVTVKIIDSLFTAGELQVDKLSGADKVNNWPLKIAVRLAYILYNHRND